MSLDTSGLLRVSLKDTPANTNKLLVTADPITFASAQSVNATLQTQTDTVMVGGVNIKEINAVTPLMGNGTTGTGSLRVTIASDNTAFAVNATLSAETTKVIGTINVAASQTIAVTNTGTFATQATLAAETTKVIGVVRTADGSGNLLTSTTNALDINIKSGSIGNTSFGATQATASSLNATVVQGTAAAITGGWPTIAGETADTTGTFTNGTQTTSITATSLSGYQAATISINGTYGTATAVFEGSDDAGTTWYTLQASRTDSATIETGYTSLTNTTRMWTAEITGLDSFRVRSTAVASGTVNIRISISAAPTTDAAVVSIGSAIPAGSAVIGHVITDSGSVTNATLSAETTKVIGTINVAASQTIAVTNTGTFAVQATLAAETTKVIGTVRNVGNVGGAYDAATNAAPPANAIQIGGVAATALPTAFTATDLTPMMLDKFGRTIVIPQAPRDLVSDQSTTITSSTAATTIVTAVASTFLDLVSLTFTNSSATGTVVQLYNDDGTTLRWTGYVPATDMRGIVFSVPFTQAAVNKAWKVITVTSVASVYVTAQFVENK